MNKTQLTQRIVSLEKEIERDSDYLGYCNDAINHIQSPEELRLQELVELKKDIVFLLKKANNL